MLRTSFVRSILGLAVALLLVPAIALADDTPTGVSSTDRASTDRAVSITRGAETTATLSGLWAADLERRILRAAPTLDPKVLGTALDAAACARMKGDTRSDLLTVIDYSMPSTDERLWTVDLRSGEILYHELVAHGMKTGQNYATAFSNINGSKQTSLGLFVTAETYFGGNGYSLRMDGLERGVNHLARERLIVIHGAWYVDEALAKKQGRIGRSWGCPAVRDAIAKPFIDTIKGGSLVFAYYPDQNWLRSSSYLAACDAPQIADRRTRDERVGG